VALLNSSREQKHWKQNLAIVLETLEQSFRGETAKKIRSKAETFEKRSGKTLLCILPREQDLSKKAGKGR
jgi:hypothetical protein